jgi:TB2/DP1, HVA22 family
MRELPKEKIFIYLGAIACVAAAAPLLHRIPRTKGRRVLWHVAYVILAALTLIFLPEYIQDEIFSPGGVVVVGTLLPVYESIVAICTIGEQDDTAWLQYWITAATISFSTEFMDDITARLPAAGEYWFETEFFFTLWLLLPMTDGAALIYDFLTKPYLVPMAQKFKTIFEGYMGLLLTMVNTSYIWVIWYALLYLPEGAKRFLVVALGTLYPICASIVSVSTSTSSLDDTMWLTYWTTFSLLFVFMDYVENFVGGIPGFYSLCAVAVVYLFLPMFNGAEVVFRRVLVPLSGQYENMLLHDAHVVKAGMLKSLPVDQHDRVLEKTAHIFLKGSKTD